MNLFQFIGALELGLIFGLVAIGVYLTFRIIDFPDLTVDGSFALGACACVVLIVSGVNPWLATLMASGLGVLAGIVTGILSIRFGILNLLAGILTMTALYSINLRIMGKPNIALLTQDTVFTQVSFEPVFLLIGITVLIVVLLSFLFKTQFGLALRATGLNPIMSRAYGVKVTRMQLLALGLSNGIVALAGALFAQLQGFSDISVGLGTIIVGLASVILGEQLIRNKKVLFALLGCIVGSVCFRVFIALALNGSSLGIQPSDLNLITALLVTVAMIAPRWRPKP